MAGAAVLKTRNGADRPAGCSRSLRTWPKVKGGPPIEGTVAKRLTGTYQPGVRSSDWVKVKPKSVVPAERFRREAK
jgi:hypothetical protein